MFTVSVLFSILGVVFFSFVLWWRLREDYTPETIYRFTLVLLLSGAAGFILAGRWLPAFSPLAGLVTSSLVGAYAVRKFNLKFFEIVDAVVISWFWLLLFMRLSSAVSILGVGRIDLVIHTYLFTGEGRQVVLGLLLAVAMVLLYSFLEKRYRRFSWYPSGKVGFVGLATLLVFLPLEGTLAFLTLPVVAAGLGVIISCSVSGAISFLVYKRSGKRK